MKRKIKSKKQLDRERNIEREVKKKDFEKQYYEQKKVREEFGLDSLFQVDSLEEFVKKNLDKWESQQLKIPTGRYQDREKVVSSYQQKFVEYIRQLCPEVIEELREFVPYFDRLFGEKKEKYIDIFDRYKNEIFDLNSSLESKVNYSIKDWFLRFRPNKFQDWRFDYAWGKYHLLFQFLYLLFVQIESAEKKEILQDINQRIQDDLVFEPNNLILPDNFDEAVIKEYIENQSHKAMEEILLNAERQYFRKEAKRKLTEFLQDISPTPDTSITDFIKLQVELLKWAERHNLKKDWLLRYAYYFLFQFSNNPNIKIEELPIEFLQIRSLSAYPFEFKFNGWFAGDEDKEDYEKRITKSFESELQRYFHNVSSHFDLEEKKRITRPIDYDRVKWLVRWTVQGWSKEQILEEIDDELQEQGIEKNYEIRTVELAFQQFAKYVLPIRK